MALTWCSGASSISLSPGSGISNDEYCDTDDEGCLGVVVTQLLLVVMLAFGEHPGQSTLGECSVDKLP